MEASRRSFLKGFLTVAAISCVPATVEAALSIPSIVGDGIHDDTDGLQAAFDGKPFICENQIVRASSGEVLVSGGTFKISRGLHIGRGNTKGYMRDFVIICPDLRPGEYILNIHGNAAGRNITLLNKSPWQGSVPIPLLP